MQEIESILKNSKTIAMIGVSSLKEKEDRTNLKRKPSTIVMKYMQDFGYKVIPVNPFAVEFDFEKMLELNKTRKEMMMQSDDLKQKRNQMSVKIGSEKRKFSKSFFKKKFNKTLPCRRRGNIIRSYC